MADADIVGASPKAQPVNPIIRSRFILVPPLLWQMLLRTISSVCSMLTERCIQRPFRPLTQNTHPSKFASSCLASTSTASASQQFGSSFLFRPKSLKVNRLSPWVTSRLFGKAAQCLLSPTADTSRSDLAGWLRVTAAATSFPGGVKRSFTQKPWRPGTPSPGLQSTSQNSVAVGRVQKAAIN
jgi:hypothetical protein